MTSNTNNSVKRFPFRVWKICVDANILFYLNLSRSQLQAMKVWIYERFRFEVSS